MSKKSRNLIDRAEQRQAESDSKAAIYKQKKTADEISRYSRLTGGLMKRGR